MLACAPSNLAVDNLVEKLGAAKAKVYYSIMSLCVCDGLVIFSNLCRLSELVTQLGLWKQFKSTPLMLNYPLQTLLLSFWMSEKIYKVQL